MMVVSGFTRSSSSSSSLLSGHLVASYDIGHDHRHSAIGWSWATCASRNLKCENDFISAAIIWSNDSKTGFLSPSFFPVPFRKQLKNYHHLAIKFGWRFFFLVNCARKIIQSQKLSDYFLLRVETCLIGHARLILDNGTDPRTN